MMDNNIITVKYHNSALCNKAKQGVNLNKNPVLALKGIETCSFVMKLNRLKIHICKWVKVLQTRHFKLGFSILYTKY